MTRLMHAGQAISATDQLRLPNGLPILICIDTLCCPQCSAELNWLADFNQNLLQGSKRADRVQIIVVSQMSDAEQFSFHFSLAVGDYCAELIAKLPHDHAGIDAIGRLDSSEGSRRTR